MNLSIFLVLVFVCFFGGFIAFHIPSVSFGYLNDYMNQSVQCACCVHAWVCLIGLRCTYVKGLCIGWHFWWTFDTNLWLYKCLSCWLIAVCVCCLLNAMHMENANFVYVTVCMHGQPHCFAGPSAHVTRQNTHTHTHTHHITTYIIQPTCYNKNVHANYYEQMFGSTDMEWNIYIILHYVLLCFVLCYLNSVTYRWYKFLWLLNTAFSVAKRKIKKKQTKTKMPPERKLSRVKY